MKCVGELAQILLAFPIFSHLSSMALRGTGPCEPLGSAGSIPEHPAPPEPGAPADPGAGHIPLEQEGRAHPLVVVPPNPAGISPSQGGFSWSPPAPPSSAFPPRLQGGVWMEGENEEGDFLSPPPKSPPGRAALPELPSVKHPQRIPG